MPCYLVKLRGSNILLSLDGEHGKFAFETGWTVKAPSSEEAGRIAMIRVYQRLNQQNQIIKNIPDAPKIEILSVSSIGLFRYLKTKRNQEFTFFPEIEPDGKDRF